MFTDPVDQYIEQLKTALDRISRDEINKFAEVLMEAYKNDAQIYIFGNGGSAATASHFACDLNKGASYGFDKRFKVICLNDNMATLMAYSNDVSYDDIFVEPLKNFIKDGDVVVGISGSGNSKNVLKAIEYANGNGNVTFGLTGYDGGNLRKVANFSINANLNNMQISEDIHLIVGHIMMSIFNQKLND